MNINWIDSLFVYAVNSSSDNNLSCFFHHPIFLSCVANEFLHIVYELVIEHLFNRHTVRIVKRIFIQIASSEHSFYYHSGFASTFIIRNIQRVLWPVFFQMLVAMVSTFYNLVVVWMRLFLIKATTNLNYHECKNMER